MINKLQRLEISKKYLLDQMTSLKENDLTLEDIILVSESCLNDLRSLYLRLSAQMEPSPGPGPSNGVSTPED